MTVLIPGRPPNGLHHCRITAQEAFFIRVQNGNTTHFRQVQSFPQQVDPHQYVKLTAPQGVNDLGPFNGGNIGMQIAYTDLILLQIFGQVFRHPFGQCGNQRPFALRRGLFNFRHQVIDLSLNRANFNFRIQ